MVQIKKRYRYKLILMIESSFDILKNNEILSKSLSTNLLGEHNVQNITAA